MKILALLLILFLQVTGLWNHLPASRQASITSQGAGIVAPAAPISSALYLKLPTLPFQKSTSSLDLDAASALAIDRTTATVLYAKSPDQRRPIASITKMITALIIISRHDPEERITIPTLPKYPVEAETMGLVRGDTLRTGDLLEAALVPSENDAADSLAIADSGSVAAFTDLMNAKMTEWGIADTHFVSASGLADTDNYASAAALAKIAGLVLANPVLTGIIAHQTISVTSGQGRTYNLKTTNDLLASGQFYGIKTGYTLAAGECFVGLTSINGHDVITVVLGSSNRFGTTTTLTNWIGRSWQWL